MTNRKIKRIVDGNWLMEGAGVKLRRIFGYGDTDLTSPFLLLDNFESSRPEDYIAGFPWHPHRGIETITYLVEGVVEHTDSLGNSGTISSGEAQWMTAGSGIVHQEMPKAYEGTMRGFQLWANLPKKHKMALPRYRDIRADEIPEVKKDGYTVKVICGDYAGVSGPAKDVVIQPWFFDVKATPGAEFTLEARPEDNVLVCVFEGKGFFDKEKTVEVGPGQLAVLEDGDALACSAGPEGVRFLLMAAKPINETVAWRGSIVMNTEYELKTAYREYKAGTFIKKPGFTPPSI